MPDPQPAPPRWDASRYGRLRSPQHALGALRRGMPDRTVYLPVLSGIARGVRLPVNPRSELRTWLGLAEIEIARTVRALVPPGGVAWDVGASIGYYSFALARLGVARIVCFEPDDRRFALLQQAIARNPRLAGRIEPHHQCVGAGSECTTVDEFVRRDPSAAPAFLKVDVEGAEAAILSGSHDVLTHHRPRLVVETHGFDLEVECLRTIVDHGYLYRVVEPQRVWPELRPIEVNRWIVATHRDDPAADVVLRRRASTRR